MFIALRVAVAIAIAAAIVGQLIVSLAYWDSRGVEHIGISVVNFFSFFTIESNVLSMVLLSIGAVILARRRSDPQWFLVARACVVTYMVTTGVVYNLLLRGIELPQGATLGWSNEVLHVIAPLYLLIDWLFAPGRRPLSYRTVWIVIVYPIVWAVYTLIRGPLTPDEVYSAPTWYPYPFLNPGLAPTGYLSVSFYILLISAVISLAGLGAVWVSRRRARRKTRAR